MSADNPRMVLPSQGDPFANGMDPFFRNLPGAQPLLATAYLNPEDDAPRLILADWLDDHGHPERAELIRLQCAPTREGSRIGDLLRGHGEQWRASLSEYARRLVVRQECAFIWRRGLLEAAHLRLRLARDVERHLEAVLGGTGIRHLRIELSRQAEDREAVLRRLVQFPLLLGLPHLNLRANRLGDQDAVLLAGSPVVAGLQSLDLAVNEIGLPGLQALGKSSHLDRLTELNLADNRIGPIEAGNGVSPLRLGHLTSLVLRDNRLMAGGVALAASPELGHLVALDLYDNWIRNDGARALATSPRVVNLKQLNLGKNLLGDGAAAALATSPHLSGLTSLDLSGNRFSARGRSQLRKRFPFVVL